MELQISKGQRIKMIRAFLGLSQDQFAKIFCININTIRTWETDRAHGLSKKGAKLICQKAQELYSLLISEEWLYKGIGSPPLLISYDDKNSNDNSINDELFLFMKNHRNSLYLSISFDTTDDFFSNGDLVAGQICENMHDTLNKYCIIVTENKTNYFGYVTKIEHESLTIQLLNNNEKTINLPLKIAPVLWCRKPDHTISKA